MEKRLPSIPCGLEVPQSFRVRASDFAVEQLTPTPGQVRRAIRESLDFISRHCAV